MSVKRSRVHSEYKTKYRVTKWPEYDRGLVRGSAPHRCSREALLQSSPAACAACAVRRERKSLLDNNPGLVREQEAGGSNPLAPTTVSPPKCGT